MNDSFMADEDVPLARLALLLKHISSLEDKREPWRVAYPLAEVLLLLTCAAIASCDDFDEIVAWGKKSSGFSAKVRAVPSRRSLRALVAHIGQSRRSRAFRAFRGEWVVTRKALA
jgi:hypothetical protein